MFGSWSVSTWSPLLVRSILHFCVSSPTTALSSILRTRLVLPTLKLDYGTFHIVPYPQISWVCTSPKAFFSTKPSCAPPTSICPEVELILVRKSTLAAIQPPFEMQNTGSGNARPGSHTIVSPVHHATLECQILRQGEGNIFPLSTLKVFSPCNRTQNIHYKNASPCNRTWCFHHATEHTL